MRYLLYDAGEGDFELFYDDAPNSTTHFWFTLDAPNDMFYNPCHYEHDVHTWVETEFDNAYILHSFPSKPTQDEVIAVIHSHPELLI